MSSCLLFTCHASEFLKRRLSTLGKPWEEPITSPAPELRAGPALGSCTGSRTEQMHKALVQRVLQGQTGNSRVTGDGEARPGYRSGCGRVARTTSLNGH